ncbi:MAG: type IV toxin-antitoxin system AbiEi family antitoxin [Luteolibacter sp.]
MKHEPELERKLEEQLRTILEQIPGMGQAATVWRNPSDSQRAFDIMAELRIPRSRDRVAFWVQCKSLPRPSQFPFVSLSNRILEDGSRNTQVPVLAAPYISPRMAELCREHGWSWYDLAGNCRLVVPGTIYIERQGNEPVHQRPKPRANLSTAASAQVLRTLLIPEHSGKRWTQTVLQKSCEPGVSIGLVNKVVTHLREEAWLTLEEDGRFHVPDPVGLIHAWAKDYRFDRHRQLSYFSLLKGQQLEQQLATLLNSKGKAAYAVFSAAELEVPNVRQNKSWLYLNDAALDDFQEMAQAKPVDSGANIVVLIPEDDGVFYGNVFRQSLALGRTNPVQTWLDLQHAGGRGHEAAEAVMERCLKPEWKAHRHV